MTIFRKQPDRRGRLTLMAIGLVICSVIVLLAWPSNSRRIQRQLETLAERTSCSGQPQADSRSELIREVVFDNFAEAAAVDVQGAVNANFDREQLVQHLTDVCEWSRQLHVHLNQVSVDISPGEVTAQARADVLVQYESESRHYSERRQADISLRRERQAYKITAIHVSASIVNQPEPRP